MRQRTGAHGGRRSALGRVRIERLGEVVRRAPPQGLEATRAESGIYRDKKSGRWRFEFDCYIEGQRHRKRRLLPAGWSRADAEAYAAKEGKALQSIAHGIASPRHAIDEAVARYSRERLPGLKHGENVKR